MFVICVAYSFAQEPTSEILSIVMPKKAIKIDKKTFLSYENRFKHPKYKNELTHEFMFQNLYYLKGVLITLYEAEFSPDDNRTLLQIQREMYGMRIDNPTEEIVNYSRIELINGIQTYICEYQEDNEIRITFMPQRFKNKWFQGSLQFKKSQKKEGEKILADILNNIHFKH
jgi:hypothetical protein